MENSFANRGQASSTLAIRIDNKIELPVGLRGDGLYLCSYRPKLPRHLMSIMNQ